MNNINTRHTNPPPPAAMDRVAGGGLTLTENSKTSQRTLAWLNSREEEIDGKEFGSNQSYTSLITMDKETYRRGEGEPAVTAFDGRRNAANAVVRRLCKLLRDGRRFLVSPE